MHCSLYFDKIIQYHEIKFDNYLSFVTIFKYFNSFIFQLLYKLNTKIQYYEIKRDNYIYSESNIVIILLPATQGPEFIPALISRGVSCRCGIRNSCTFSIKSKAKSAISDT